MYYDQYGYPHYTPQEMAQQRGMAPPPPPPQPQPPQETMPAQPRFICRPVASYEEALASPTDFSGNTLVLTDFPHGQIYTKVLSRDGSSILDIYRRVAPPQAQAEAPVPDVEYAPMSELSKLREEVEDLRAKLAETSKAAPKKGKEAD